MDFLNRTVQHQAAGPAPDAVELPTGPRRNPQAGRGREDKFTYWTRIGSGFMLVIVALLVATLAWLIFTATPASQDRYVDPSKLQAVFLNNGQVYFGNIEGINKDYVLLTNVYYLQTSSTNGSASSQASNISLVKLGCELHRPFDRMVINATQVTFWENLQANGQVAQAVSQWEQQHPNGQQCSQVPSSQSNPQTQSTTK